MRKQKGDATTLQRVLLICGVVSSLLYVGIDALAAMFFGDYHSFTSQAISEQMAVGAPTERLVDPLFLLYGVLLIAFALGVWRAAGGDRLLRASAAFMFTNAVVGMTGPLLFEMDVRGTGDGRRDALHVALTGVIVLLILAAIGFGAFTRGRRFKIYSFATVVTMVVFGALAGYLARDLATGGPTPWFGLAERINIGAYLLWVVVLAVSLLRDLRTAAPRSPNLSRPGQVPIAMTESSASSPLARL
jgi:hypothetical protein